MAATSFDPNAAKTREGASTSSSSSPVDSKLNPEFWSKRDVGTKASFCGTTLLNRAETIFNKTKELRSFVQSASAHPMRAGCSIVSLLVGLGSLLTGDLFSGTVATICGAKELWNLSHPDSIAGLERLFNDIHADVGMIHTLEEANQESCRTVQSNLGLISQGVTTLHNQLDSIAKINADGLSNVQNKKTEALEQNAAAITEYEKATKLFQSAQEKLTQSQTQYGQCGQFFTTIDRLAKNEDPNVTVQEKIDALLQAAGSASEACRTGKTLLDTAALDLAYALDALQRADTLKDRATTAFAQATQMAEDALQAGAERTAYTHECQQTIEATQQEMSRIQLRSQQIISLILDLRDDINAAKAEAQGRFGLTEVSAGIAVAAVMVPPLGLTYGAITGFSAMFAVRNTPTISSAASAVYNYVMGIEVPLPEPMQESELIRAEFSETSSGYWGYYVKRTPSTTVGTIQVNLGRNHVIALPFNLNQRDKIAKADLLGLFHVLTLSVTNGSLTPLRCLEILNQLETITMDRGPLNSAQRGFICTTSSTYAIITMLRETCQQRIALTTTSSN